MEPGDPGPGAEGYEIEDAGIVEAGGEAYGPLAGAASAAGERYPGRDVEPGALPFEGRSVVGGDGVVVQDYGGPVRHVDGFARGGRRQGGLQSGGGADDVLGLAGLNGVQVAVTAPDGAAVQQVGAPVLGNAGVCLQRCRLAADGGQAGQDGNE